VAIARRVQLVPPEAWDEARLLDATRQVAASRQAIRPGDAVGDLVVIGVDPEPGAVLSEETEVEILPTARSGSAALVDLAILLDVSESMGTPWDAKLTRLEAARTALAPFLAQPGPSIATVSLFEYAKEARLVAGPVKPAKLKLPAPNKPKGHSATGVALNAALAHLAARTTPTRAQVIFLLTDGIGEVAEVLHASERAARLRIPVHSLVFAPEMDEVFDELAGASGGSAQTAALPLTIEFEHQPGGS